MTPTHTEESSPELVEQIRDFIYDCTTDDCGHGWTLSAHQTDDLIAKVRASISSTPATTDEVCKTCDGRGVYDSKPIPPDTGPTMEFECYTCEGTGRASTPATTALTELLDTEQTDYRASEIRESNFEKQFEAETGYERGDCPQAEYDHAFKDWLSDRQRAEQIREGIQALADKLLCDDREKGDTLNGLLSEFDDADLIALAAALSPAKGDQK